MAAPRGQSSGLPMKRRWKNVKITFVRDQIHSPLSAFTQVVCELDLFDSMFYGDFDKLLEKLRESYNEVKSELGECRKTIEEWNSDIEIKKVRDELEGIRSRALLIMSARELELAKDFREMHYKSCKNGSTYRYELCGTGVGTAITIICPVCGEEKNITDYECW